MKDYPVPVRTRSGCKVDWLVYATLDEANRCAELAKIKAADKESRGYDFGYQSPGLVTKIDDGYEVCIP